MEKQDRLPVLLITLVYAATAFFLLGDTAAPQSVYEFAGGEPVTIAVYGDAVYTTGIRYYSGLGTGAYNVEISADGENWLTLWQRKNDPEDTEKVTGWYWAQAEDYDPSYALTQKYNQLYKWIDITVENPQNVRFLRITGKAEKPNLRFSKFCLWGRRPPGALPLGPGRRLQSRFGSPGPLFRGRYGTRQVHLVQHHPL